MTDQDPFTLLKKDHREVEVLFAKLSDTTEQAKKTRAELFEKLKNALDYHSHVEETFLYPVLEDVADTKALALEAEEEHKQVRTLLAEIEDLDETTPEWTAKLTVLQENIEHHVKEEESELFPKAEKVLSEKNVELMAESIARAEEEKVQS